MVRNWSKKCIAPITRRVCWRGPPTYRLAKVASLSTEKRLLTCVAIRLAMRRSCRLTRSCYPEIVLNKREYFEARLRAGSGFLHLDARRPGVIVPDAFSHDPHLV